MLFKILYYAELGYFIRDSRCFIRLKNTDRIYLNNIYYNDITFGAKSPHHMTIIASRSQKNHEGQNLKRFREMLGIKQETLAYELGENWNQKKISLIESKERIEAGVLTEIAKVLKLPEAAIRNFDEEVAIFNIQKSYDQSFVPDFQPTFNPLDKLVETLEALNLLHAENKNLYERLLESEKEKIKILKARYLNP